MGTNKKVTNKKVTKKVIVKPEMSDEDLILGRIKKDEMKTVVMYEDKSINYKVTNLKMPQNVNIFDGSNIEIFIGSGNLAARQALINGAKEVITKDANGKDAYKIEVVL